MLKQNEAAPVAAGVVRDDSAGRGRVPRIILLLVIVEVALAAIYLAFTEVNRVRQFYTLFEFFDLNREANVPTWFSSLQLAGAAAMVAGLAWHLRSAGRSAWGVWALAAFLGLLSLDEAAGLHEFVGRTLERSVSAIGETRLGMKHTGPWMVVALPIGIAAAWFAVVKARRHLADHPGSRSAMSLLVAALVLLIGSAVLPEVLTNFAGEFHPLQPSRTWALLIAMEELGEMLAGTLLLWSAWLLLRAHGLAPIGRPA